MPPGDREQEEVGEKYCRAHNRSHRFEHALQIVGRVELRVGCVLGLETETLKRLREAGLDKSYEQFSQIRLARLLISLKAYPGARHS